MADNSSVAMLSHLSNEARAVVSRLDKRRLIPSDRDENLPRDYRGLAFCIDVTAQDLDSVKDQQTMWLLKTWLRRNDGSAIVQQLLQYLERIDRYDIRDDLLALEKEQKLINVETSWVNMASRVESQVATVDSEEDLVTFEDMENGAPVVYDALVLHADADAAFVKNMMERMTSCGFKLCTKHSLRPGLMQYRSVTQLIEARCRYVILVYSPEFFTSPDEEFFMDYVHALNIKTNGRRLLPCMYRQCQLPSHYSFYHNLYYESETYDFWTKLSSCLTTTRTPRITAASPPPSTVRIREIKDHTDRTANGHSNRTADAYTRQPGSQTLQLPELPATLTTSLTSLASLEPRPNGTTSLSDISRIKSKSGISKLLKKPFKMFSRKNKSKQILVDYTA